MKILEHTSMKAIVMYFIELLVREMRLASAGSLIDCYFRQIVISTEEF